MRMRYTCKGCMPVIRSGDFAAGLYFAGVLARDTFIGIPCADGISGHNIMFSVTTENA